MISFGYDTSGRLGVVISDEHKGHRVRRGGYVYDVLGNLLSATLPGGTTTLSYVIDGQNRRVGKLVNGALTQGFVYDGQLRIVAQLDGANNVVSRFVYGSRANVPDCMVQNGIEYRIVSDNLGSPRLVVNAQIGAIAEQIDYDEFGNVTADTNPGFIPFGFAGGLYDQDLKLVRFGARDYDPDAGRWTSKAPLRKTRGGSILREVLLLASSRGGGGECAKRRRSSGGWRGP